MKFTGERFLPELTGQIRLEHLNRYHFVIHQIDLSGKIVLDIASGEGYGSDLLAKFSLKVFGIDIDQETVFHAKNNYQRDNLTFIQGNATSLPLTDHSVDVVVSFETIEHHNRHEEMCAEIKRVLKPEGVLIISSPDRYYYSDSRHHKNDYHIRELYYEEFMDLINSYFKKTRFYSQRIFVGSMIFYDGAGNHYAKPLLMEADCSANDFTPLYNIAVATDGAELKGMRQIFLYKEFDYIMTKRDLDRKVGEILDSKTYRLGYFLTYPFRLLRKLLING